jgi:hypothetical protein
MSSSQQDQPVEVECFALPNFEAVNPRAYSDYSVHCAGEISFRKKTSDAMSMLWKHFCKMNDFPEFYLRTVARIALCKDPDTMQEEHHDALDIQCENVDTLTAGQTITIKNNRFMKDAIFQRWDDRVFHKFKMRSGFYSFLRQDLIDKLSDQDRRYLCIGR